MHFPEFVYNNWSAYDELSDNVVLTEELAMRELQEILRLRANGVRIEYYLMDAFWYAPEAGYRTWRQPHWPHGPERWLRSCLENGLKPGLWVATNAATQHSQLVPPRAWKDSLDPNRSALCLFEGGFLADFMEALQYWYDRGVRMFKFDFARLQAATPHAEASHLPDEIHALNSAALRGALIAFRQRNSEVRLLAYNGFGGEMANTSLPFRKAVDTRWLEAFDTLYCGDPRPADVPAYSFARAVDIYSDHMVFNYQRNGVPLERIDHCAFMMGICGTCYARRAQAWKGMLILSLARGGWMNIYYGNLELLDDEQARWFARVQQLFLPLLVSGHSYTFGGMPGERQAYGFANLCQNGALYTVVNPTQATVTVRLPRITPYQPAPSHGRLLFADAGYRPELDGDSLRLGPEQLALVGLGAYAAPGYDLGVQEDVVIPAAIESLAADFEECGHNQIAATITPPPTGGVRMVLRQSDQAGIAFRSSRGSPPAGISLANVLCLRAEQDGQQLPVVVNYDKAIWSGLSWAVGEVPATALRRDRPLIIHASSTEERPLRLAGEVYGVEY
jgi:hypothetical protein